MQYIINQIWLKLTVRKNCIARALFLVNKMKQESPHDIDRAFKRGILKLEKK